MDIESLYRDVAPAGGWTSPCGLLGGVSMVRAPPTLSGRSATVRDAKARACVKRACASISDDASLRVRFAEVQVWVRRNERLPSRRGAGKEGRYHKLHKAWTTAADSLPLDLLVEMQSWDVYLEVVVRTSFADVRRWVEEEHRLPIRGVSPHETSLHRRYARWCSGEVVLPADLLAIMKSWELLAIQELTTYVSSHQRLPCRRWGGGLEDRLAKQANRLAAGFEELSPLLQCSLRALWASCGQCIAVAMPTCPVPVPCLTVRSPCAARGKKGGLCDASRHSEEPCLPVEAVVDLGLAADVVDALRSLVLDFVQDVHNGEKVTAALFVCARSCVHVQRALRRAGQEFGAVHVSFLQDLVRSCSDARVARDFFDLPALAQLTSTELLALACDGQSDTAHRCAAIQVLLRHFPLVLEGDRRASPLRYEGYSYEKYYWQAQLRGCCNGGGRAEGRICCTPSATVSVDLVIRGVACVPCAFVAPVLPIGIQGCARQHDRTGEAQRLCVREGGSDGSGLLPHGYRLIALPSDYLCASCVTEFEALDLEGLSGELCLEWAARLQLQVRDSDLVALRVSLGAEQGRQRLRGRALGCARRVRSDPCSHEFEFLEFQRFLRLDDYESSVVVASLATHQRDVLEGEVFHPAPAGAAGQARPGRGGEGSARLRRGFGVACEGAAPRRLWCSGVVPHGQVPCAWTDYIGRPGFVCESHWYLRAWAIAVGGWQYMGDALHAELLRLEQQRDSRYVFIRRVVEDPASSLHALELWPGGLPEARVWIAMCGAHPAHVMLMRQRVYEERDRKGVVWSRASNAWHLSGALLTHACGTDTARRRAIAAGHAILRSWTGLSVDTWMQRLHGGSCGLSAAFARGGGRPVEISLLGGVSSRGCADAAASDPGVGAVRADGAIVDGTRAVGDAPRVLSRRLKRYRAEEGLVAFAAAPALSGSLSGDMVPVSADFSAEVVVASVSVPAPAVASSMVIDLIDDECDGQDECIFDVAGSVDRRGDCRGVVGIESPRSKRRRRVSVSRAPVCEAVEARSAPSGSVEACYSCVVSL